MDLMRINDVVGAYGLSSRTLRYYEQTGILWSTHPDSKAQRYYDEAALERLRQIIVLRKLQIPIKDIAAIFRDNSTVSLIRSFMDKLHSLDGEITALSELRRLVDDFLQKMMSAGITKISAITLLYEETEKRLPSAAERKPVTIERLSEVSRSALRLHDIRLIRLPSMRVLTSRMKSGELAALDGDSMQNLFTGYGILPTPGMRDCFFLRKPDDSWLMSAKIPDDFINTTPYTDIRLKGGLYAVASSFMEDMDVTFGLLREWVIGNANYELDTDENGVLTRDEMIEELMPWDIARAQNLFQQDIFIPVRIKQGGRHDMSKRTLLEQVSEETMRFMRGKYRLDEVGNGKDELKFRGGGKTVLTVYIHDDHYDFLVIFGKAEREKFEQERESFPKAIRDIYDGSKTYHDGKWMRIPVSDLETLEAVKRLVMMKKKPNRKPFPKETAVYTKCWHRCDLCIYYSIGTFSEEFRKELCERFTRVYHVDDFSARCPGCYIKSETEACEPLKCAKAKDLDRCQSCKEDHCTIPPVASFQIEPKSILADDVTWAVLPYVHGQCGN